VSPSSEGLAFAEAELERLRAENKEWQRLNNHLWRKLKDAGLAEGGAGVSEQGGK
jgi:hypothetical protein